MKVRVLFTEGLSDNAERILKKYRKILETDVYKKISRERLLQIASDYDIICVKTQTKIDPAVLKAAKKLKIIARAGVGLDHIHVKEALKRKIQIIHTPEASSIAVAELTIGLLVALARKAKLASESLYSGQWRNFDAVGFQLSGKNAGIIGLGRIGKLVAKRLSSFGISVAAYDPYVSKAEAKKISVKLLGLKDLLRKSDILLLHAPLTDETFQIISKKNINYIKRGAFLINTARGSLVKENDILNALEKNILSGYATDVLEIEPPSLFHPFLKHPRVICTPHIAAQTREAQDQIQSLLANRIVKFVKTGKVEKSPDLRWALMWTKKQRTF